MFRHVHFMPIGVIGVLTRGPHCTLNFQLSTFVAIRVRLPGRDVRTAFPPGPADQHRRAE